ncbi:hypothetical protein ACJVDH_12650 [Pedobacter sp. AW1-32]|uniref:hypothetical protein n=1 Tax=Pedobacter sp. AW1-32 TaxID=3383026 RepID=UPI003FF085F6
MPLTPLSTAALSAFHNNLQEQKNTPEESFATLRELNNRFAKNAEDLTTLEYGTALIELEGQYDERKTGSKTAYQALKQQQKNLDDRILAIEQKLYLGLPQDLAEMEKVIVEQEAIVADQEKINQQEEDLLENMRKIDVDHGKKLAALEQSSHNRLLPLKAVQEKFKVQIDQAEKQFEVKTRLFSIAPIVLIPIALDFLAVKLGIQKSAENDYAFAHYIFILSFLVLQIFFAQRFKDFFNRFFTKSACLTLFTELETRFIDNERAVKSLEHKYQVKLSEVVEAMQA